MAKSKSSTLEPISSKSTQALSSSDSNRKNKTGIDIAGGLNFELPVSDSSNQDTKENDLSNADEQTNIDLVEYAPIGTIGATEEDINETPSTGLKKQQLNTGNRYHISVYISEKARRNLNKYKEIYGYRKTSPFISELLENLDAYL